MSTFVDVVFDGSPGPEGGRFLEVENESGASVKVGEWIDRGNGLWALRIQQQPTWAEIATLCHHGSVICALCNFVPESWKPAF
jgi:hypothetical protein